MEKHLKKLPQDVIDLWPEVLNDVELEVLPIKYLLEVSIHFKSGKIWNVDLTDTQNVEAEDSLNALFVQYESEIDHLDFKLDTNKIKTDITKRTASFMKKKK